MSETTGSLKATCAFAVVLCLGIFTCGVAAAQDQNRDQRGDQHQKDDRAQNQPPKQEQRQKPQQRAPEQKAQQQQQRSPENRSARQATPAQAQQRAPQERRAQGQPRKLPTQEAPQERQRAQQQPSHSAKQPQRTQEAQHPQATRPAARPPAQEQARQSGHAAGQAPRTEARGATPPARDLQAARRVPQNDERNVFAQNRAQDWQSQHRDWRERGGYHGYRIPTAQFSTYFGPRHLFRIYSLPLDYVDGYPEFQYNGVWFTLLDPVPGYFPPDWYQTDQVYVNYDPASGGYYLYDTRYPNVALAVAPSVD